MPFDESPKDPKQRIGLKNINGQKSMFENIPKPPTQQEFQQKVQEAGDKMSGYKQQAANLFIQFSKAINDKTLSVNRNLFAIEAEKEMLQSMVQLAIQVNNDPLEQEGMGSLTWITCLFKTCLAQRDRINDLDFELEKIKKQLSSNNLTDFISKEVAKVLDKKQAGG